MQLNINDKITKQNSLKKLLDKGMRCKTVHLQVTILRKARKTKFVLYPRFI